MKKETLKRIQDLAGQPIKEERFYIGEARRQEALRFDADARVEIWVSPEDLIEDDEFDGIVNSTEDDAVKRARLRGLAEKVARKRLSEIDAMPGVQVTAEIGTDKINMDRIDWDYLIHGEPEEA